MLSESGLLQQFALTTMLDRIEAALEPNEYADWFESTECPNGLTLDERNRWFYLAVVAKSRTAL